MDIKKINNIIRNPKEISSISNDDLDEIIKKYPYFQQAYAIRAKKKVKDEGIENVKSVYAASILSTSRKELKEYIHSPFETEKGSRFSSTEDLENENLESIEDHSILAGVGIASTAAGAVIASTASEEDDQYEENNLSENGTDDADLSSSEESSESDEEQESSEKYSLDNKEEVLHDEELELAGDILTEKSEDEVEQEIDEMILDDEAEYSGDLPVSESLESEILEDVETAEEDDLNLDADSSDLESSSDSSAAIIASAGAATLIAGDNNTEADEETELDSDEEEVHENEDQETENEETSREASSNEMERIAEENIESEIEVDSKNRKKFDEKILPRLGLFDAEQKDDFRLINDITEEIEQKLNGLGIYRFDQLRKLYTEDIPILSLVTDIDAEKIQKERWFEQAFKIWSVESMEEVLDRVGRADPRLKDDLTQIKGIGKVLATKLNAVQLTTFDQISRFNTEDIGIVNDVIEFFPGRIERDDWVSQAKSFLSVKADIEEATAGASVISLSNSIASEKSSPVVADDSLSKLKAKLERHKELKSSLNKTDQEVESETDISSSDEVDIQTEAENSTILSDEHTSSIESEPIVEEAIDMDLTEDQVFSEPSDILTESEEELEEEFDLSSQEGDKSDEESENDIETEESQASELDNEEESAEDEDEGANSFTGWLEKLEQENSEKKKTELNEPIMVKVDEDNVKEIHEFLGTDPENIQDSEIRSFQIADMAKKSLQDNEELVTETLARVYESQELWRKAILVYEKLRLKYPEKSSFFASRIKDLTQNL